MAVHIVVDSTSDISREQAQANDITVVPLTVSFGEEDFKDGIDLDNQTFYAKMAKSPTLPVTGAPNLEDFKQAYRQAIKQGATGILSIHISGALSGTHNIAAAAAEQLKAESKVPIQILDSRTVSAGIGWPALLAARRAQEGATLDDLVASTQSMLERSKLYFLLDTLDNLQRGGRIGKAQAVVGAMFNIKPILGIRDGIVVSIERVRTRSKALTRIGELVRDLKPIETMALATSDDAAGADMLEAVKPYFDGHIEIFKLGAVIGTHAGAHAAGLFVTPQKA